MVDNNIKSIEQVAKSEVNTRGIRGDGSDAYELALLIQYGLFNEPTYAWHPGSFDSTVESIVYHYNKHGKEVNASSAASYLNKAIEFRRTAKKNSTKSKVSGSVYGVILQKEWKIH